MLNAAVWTQAQPGLFAGNLTLLFSITRLTLLSLKFPFFMHFKDNHEFVSLKKNI
jgi:hypothetical protein